MKRLILIFFIVLVIIFSGVNFSSDVFFAYAGSVDSSYEINESSECCVVKIDREKVAQLIKNLNLVFTKRSNVSGRDIIEGYTNKLNDYVVINNKRVNVQISIYDDVCIVGYPIIKNSF